MEGFIQCNIISKNLYSHVSNYTIDKNNSSYKYDNWNLMRKAGLFPYPELNIYVNPVYGAWMGNINIKNISELLSSNQYDLDRVTEIPFIEYINAGYELVIGPGVPQTNGMIYGKGIYYKNWQDIIKQNNLNASNKKYMIG